MAAKKKHWRTPEIKPDTEYAPDPALNRPVETPPHPEPIGAQYGIAKLKFRQTTAQPWRTKR